MGNFLAVLPAPTPQQHWVEVIAEYLALSAKGDAPAIEEMARKSNCSVEQFEKHLANKRESAQQLLFHRAEVLREEQRRRRAEHRRESANRPKRAYLVLSVDDWLEILVDYSSRKAGENPPTIAKVAGEYGVNPRTFQFKLSQLRGKIHEKLLELQRHAEVAAIQTTESTTVEAVQVAAPAIPVPAAKQSEPNLKKILVVGGKDYNIPKWMRRCLDVRQMEQDDNRPVYRLIGTWVPDVIIVFRSFISKQKSDQATDLSRLWKIPCIHATAGMTSIVPVAERLGLGWLAASLVRRS